MARRAAFHLSSEAVEELNCVVCLENKTLLLLPCQHRCCKECTDNIRGGATHFTCPICRRDVQVPPEGLPVCMLTEYLKNQLKIVQEGGDGDKSGKNDKCEACSKKDVEMECKQCEKFLCCRCTLDNKCQASGHDIKYLEEVMKIADDRFQAWVQFTENELSQMEEELRVLENKYQEKKTLLSSVRTVLASDISVMDRLGIINQTATGMESCTANAKEFTTSHGLSVGNDDNSQFNITRIFKIGETKYKHNDDMNEPDSLAFILDATSAEIVIGTNQNNIVSFKNKSGTDEKPYVIAKYKVGLPESYTSRSVTKRGRLVFMDRDKVVKILENVQPDKQSELRTSFAAVPTAMSCAQVDEEHVYVSDLSQKAIMKYDLTGNVVHVLHTPNLHSPWIIRGDTKRKHLYVRDNKNKAISMLSNDKLLWSIPLEDLLIVATAVREVDGKVFYIGRKALPAHFEFHLVVRHPSTGKQLCTMNISDLFPKAITYVTCLRDMAVVENTLWIVTADNEVIQTMLA